MDHARRGGGPEATLDPPDPCFEVGADGEQEEGPVVLVVDALGEAELRSALLACCHAPAWAARLAARRPFGDLPTLLAASDAELAASDEADVDVALSAHPRIGERPAGADSRREQSAVLAGDEAVLTGLAEGNRVYEERFGHVYLVCAAGRTGEELLAVLRSRLDNDPATERTVLRAELAAITRLRLTRLEEGSA